MDRSLLRDIYQIFLQSTGVSIDTRTLQPGNLFFALRGDDQNGEKFVDEAFEKGAVACITHSIADKNCICVEDTLIALQNLARHHRQTLQTPLLAITGSNGKTTTRALTAAVLNEQFELHVTAGNYNNHIGVPLTLLQLRDRHQIALIEMGANHAGEIKKLCQIATPQYGLITNVGDAHLEGFGSRQGVFFAKGELVDYLAETGGTFFLNAEEPSVLPYEQKIKKVIRFDLRHIPGKSSVLEIKHFRYTPCIEFEIFSELSGPYPIHSTLYGRGNFMNILCAIAIGAHFGVSPHRMQTAINSFSPVENRSEIIKVGDLTFFMDAYNANPTSVGQAITAFSQLNQDSKGVILGDMLELGPDAILYHRQILQMDELQQLHPVILIGDMYREAAERQKDHPFNCFDTVEEAADWVMKHQNLSSYYLVKGSRKVQLEKIISLISSSAL